MHQAHKPATASLLAKAFRVDRHERGVSIAMDHSLQNMIPMLESDHHVQALQRTLKELIGARVDIDFVIDQDPSVAEARNEASKALEFVQSDPKVRYALEVFKGSIVKCEPMDNGEPND